MKFNKALRHLMKFLSPILLALVFQVNAEQEIPWVQVGEASEIPYIEKSINVAKTWALGYEYFQKNNSITSFEYTYAKEINRHVVAITPIYNAKYMAVDGEYCVYTNEKHEYINSRQCMAP